MLYTPEQKAMQDLKGGDPDLEPLISHSTQSTDFTYETIMTESPSIHSRDDIKSVYPKKVLLGLSVKKETSYMNLLAMVMLPFIVSASCTFVNSSMPLILESEDYFAID